MNWARGFFRLWLVLSVLWIGATAWMERDRLCEAPPAARRVEAAVITGPLLLARLDETLIEGVFNTVADCLPRPDRVAAWWRSREPVLLVVLGPPIAAFLAGCALLWVGRGFRRPG